MAVMDKVVRSVAHVKMALDAIIRQASVTVGVVLSEKIVNYSALMEAMGVTVYKLVRALRTKPAHVVSSTVHVSVFLVSMVTTVSLTVPWGSMENNVKKDVTVFMARFVRLQPVNVFALLGLLVTVARYRALMAAMVISVRVFVPHVTLEYAPKWMVSVSASRIQQVSFVQHVREDFQVPIVLHPIPV